MNKVITINLAGTAFQLEEGGYDLLRVYLDTATTRLEHNPDRDEILSDIETALADKFRALLTSHKTVVVTKEVSTVLAEMGPVEADPDDSRAKAGTTAEPKPSGTAPPKRLYRISDGAMLAGVCNGIAAYFSIDPTFVRLAFVLLTIFWGTGFLVYLVMAFVVPEAVSPEEKAAASGNPMTAQEFIRRAKEGYYEAMRNFPHGQHRGWSRRFRREMRANAARWRQEWRQHWYSGWSPHPGCHPRASLALPVLSLLAGTVAIVWICALISLLATGMVFGVALPDDLPIWVAAMVLFMAYAILGGSLKAARRFCCWGAGPAKNTWPIVFFSEALVWCGVLAILFWLAVHHFPELRHAIDTIPTQAHQAASDIRDWWNGK